MPLAPGPALQRRSRRQTLPYRDRYPRSLAREPRGGKRHRDQGLPFDEIHQGAHRRHCPARGWSALPFSRCQPSCRGRRCRARGSRTARWQNRQARPFIRLARVMLIVRPSAGARRAGCAAAGARCSGPDAAAFARRAYCVPAEAQAAIGTASLISGGKPISFATWLAGQNCS